MARLPYLDKADLAPADQDLLARGINLHRALVHSPNGARAFIGLGKFIRHQSRLDPRLREMAILQVGYLARSPYEWSHHVKIGYDYGVTDADIRAIIDDTEGRPTTLAPLEASVLRGAREMAGGTAMSATTFATLKAALGAEHLADLAMTIAFYAGVVRLLATLEIDVEPDYQRYIDAFPLPRD